MAKDSAWLCQLGGGWCGFGELCRYRGGKLDADCGGVAAWPHRATATARRRRRGDRLVTGDVRYWPKADIASCTAHVRFWGQSGHDFCGMSALPPLADMCGAARDVRFGPKADIRQVTRSPRRRNFAPIAAR